MTFAHLESRVLSSGREANSKKWRVAPSPQGPKQLPREKLADVKVALQLASAVAQIVRDGPQPAPGEQRLHTAIISTRVHAFSCT